MKYVVKVVVYTDITTADCCIVRPLFRDDFEHENFGLAIQENCESHDSKCTEQQTSMLFLVIPKKKYHAMNQKGDSALNSTHITHIFFGPHGQKSLKTRRRKLVKHIPSMVSNKRMIMFLKNGKTEKKLNTSSVSWNTLRIFDAHFMNLRHPINSQVLHSKKDEP
jgi:hypothetical protein